MWAPSTASGPCFRKARSAKSAAIRRSPSASTRALDAARPAEPTTGLHFDDVAKLLRAFRQLLAAGHSLVVIEHNLDVMRASDWIVDLGPEGGDAGGYVVCEGTPTQVMAHPSSHTGQALREYQQKLGKPLTPTAKEPAGPYPGNPTPIHNAREHNLKNIDVENPRGPVTVITRVSGSGQSTLAFDVLVN